MIIIIFKTHEHHYSNNDGFTVDIIKVVNMDSSNNSNNRIFIMIIINISSYIMILRIFL